jgi:serine protease Do
VIDSLRKGQRPSRGYLGAGLQQVDEDTAPALGVAKESGELVGTLVPNGPGARGGLQQGDVITKVNGQQVTPEQTVSYLIANTPVGARIPLEIVRNFKRATVTVQVGERPTEEALNKIVGGDDTGTGAGAAGGAVAVSQNALGLSLTPLTPDLARAANLPANASGVMVTKVDPNSVTGDIGFQRGDLIVSVNNQPVTSPAQVIAAIDAARKAGRPSVLMLVKRGTSQRFVGVSIAGR